MNQDQRYEQLRSDYKAALGNFQRECENLFSGEMPSKSVLQLAAEAGWNKEWENSGKLPMRSELLAIMSGEINMIRSLLIMSRHPQMSFREMYHELSFGDGEGRSQNYSPMSNCDDDLKHLGYINNSLDYVHSMALGDNLDLREWKKGKSLLAYHGEMLAELIDIASHDGWNWPQALEEIGEAGAVKNLVQKAKAAGQERVYRHELPLLEQLGKDPASFDISQRMELYREILKDAFSEARTRLVPLIDKAGRAKANILLHKRGEERGR